jgi:DNA (cytosine-5)-methyltransferase 1
MRALELFAGAGGLAMGVSLAGFKPLGVVEWDRWACDTIRENQGRGFPTVQDWPLTEGDVRQFDLSSIPEGIELIAGGPPCQPFSMGGKHRAYEDDRDMFPTSVDIVRKVRPKAFIMENVRGLTRPTFTNYFSYIILQFTFPEIKRRREESWMDHLARLEREKTSGKRNGLTYDVVYRVINAADYGVPQKRERVFIVGFRHDLGARWSFPDPTHSLDALLVEQWVTAEYWERHRIAKRVRPAVPDALARRVARARKANERPTDQAWATTRDALLGMTDPEKSAGIFRNHRFQPGARVYPGHTGSALDLPAKTLKAGDHGVPGGENMMVKDDGSVRYFTVRESARLQTFPDGYEFHGAWSEAMRQLGNAVPVALAHLLASSVADKLLGVEHEALLASASRKDRKNGVAGRA